MACMIGQTAEIYVKGKVKPIQQLLNWSITTNRDSIDKTCVESVWITSVDDKKSWTGSFEVQFVKDDTDGQAAIDLFHINADAAFSVKFYARKSAPYVEYWEGDVILTSLSITASRENLITKRFSFQGTGPLTKKQNPA